VFISSHFKSFLTTWAISNCHGMQKAAALDHCIGNWQYKNLVIKVCNAGNAVDLSRHVIYSSKSSIKLHSSQNCKKGTAYLAVSLCNLEAFLLQ
jgi:hypothetical protein